MRLTELGRSLFERGLTHGRTGNLSIRVGDGDSTDARSGSGDTILVTPTGASLGALDGLSRIGLDSRHREGPPPTKEAFLHAALYRARPEARAVVHLHSPFATAVSCMDGLDPASAIPPLTAYFTMRVGRLPLLPYYAPGDAALGPVAEAAAAGHHALLLANHGPIVAGPDLATAADAVEEIEATARIFLLLQGLPTRPLTEGTVR
ncbi:class II aldolase/adducin family protein [Glycomyces sp. NPDC047010]|uniref:class II aldolase/adducin family protein n=1 Tax=Glycomyces sp. NPDC047010 TaxID=3155023 RepID=UPI0034038CFC